MYAVENTYRGGRGELGQGRTGTRESWDTADNLRCFQPISFQETFFRGP